MSEDEEPSNEFEVVIPAESGGIDLNTCPDRQETVRKGQAQWAKTAKDAMGEWTARWDVDAAYIEGGQKTSIYWDEIEAGSETGLRSLRMIRLLEGMQLCHFTFLCVLSRFRT